MTRDTMEEEEVWSRDSKEEWSVAATLPQADRQINPKGPLRATQIRKSKSKLVKSLLNFLQ